LIFLPLLFPAASAEQPFETIPRGPVASATLQETERATLISLAHLARIGIVLDLPPKVYVAATRNDYADVLMEIGRYSRDEADRRAQNFSGQAFRGALAVNIPRVEEQRMTVLWTIAHEVFHLYQSQSRLPYRMSFFASESAADVHKLKVLEEQQVISLRAYVRTTLVPRARAVRRAYPSYSLSDWSVPANDFYALSAVGGLYLFEQYGGWPKIVALYASNTASSFAARFEEVYGKPFAGFEQEFYSWLDRQ